MVNGTSRFPSKPTLCRYSTGPPGYARLCPAPASPTTEASQGRMRSTYASPAVRITDHSTAPQRRCTRSRTRRRDAAPLRILRGVPGRPPRRDRLRDRRRRRTVPLADAPWADGDADGRLLVATVDGRLQIRHRRLLVVRRREVACSSGRSPRAARRARPPVAAAHSGRRRRPGSCPSPVGLA
jgi:hypothetical protein